MLDKNLVEKVLQRSLESGGDFAEVFFEDSRFESINVGAGKVKSINSEVVSGVGIRVMKGCFYAYAATNDLSEAGLLKAAAEAAAAIKEKTIISDIRLLRDVSENKHKCLKTPFSLPKADKIDILHHAAETALKADERIKRADGSIGESFRRILVANSEGLWAEEERYRNTFRLMAIAEDGNSRYSSFFSRARTDGLDFYLHGGLDTDINKMAEASVRMLYSENCPAGRMPVVLMQGRGALLFHEACGHSLEATAVAKKTSVLYGRQGQQIANEQITLMDDGTMPGMWGTTAIDDEGNKTRNNVLIENGILKNYLVDKFNGRLMKAEANGCSRRESYLIPPTSRMNNTYLAGGKYVSEEIISSVKNGLYVVDFSGGSVDTASGNFNFSANQAYLIENGKITKPVRGAKLVGNSAEVLMNIDMVGNDFVMDKGLWTCGSLSGKVPVSHGMPTVRIAEMTVGGQK